MRRYILTTSLLLMASFAWAKTNNTITDFRNLNASAEVQHMQDFHLKQADEKIANNELAHAWGDLAVVVCEVPNHHVALKKMLEIATKLGKDEELKLYFDKALRMFPEDVELQAMRDNFVKNNVKN